MMANLAATNLASVTSTSAVGSPMTKTGVLHEIRFFWRQFIVAAFDPYRPELYYMRGPGPACRAKGSDSPQT